MKTWKDASLNFFFFNIVINKMYNYIKSIHFDEAMIK
jgi:hypothetical protein